MANVKLVFLICAAVSFFVGALEFPPLGSGRCISAGLGFWTLSTLV